MRKWSLVLLISATIFCYGCVTVYNPATQKQEYIFIDTKSEVSLGQNFSKQIESEFKVSKDKDLLERVNRIGNNIAQFSDRKDLVYSFNVVEDKEINAFALPGGFIYVHSALLKITDDDELAGVIAHEIGHVEARHSVKAMQAALGYNLFRTILFSKEEYASAGQASDVLFNVMHLKYSRADELQADKLSIKYAYLAGYDPESMISFLNKLKQEEARKGGGEGILLLRSHPYINQRIAQAKEEINLLKTK